MIRILKSVKMQTPVFKSILFSYLLICMILFAVTTTEYINYSISLRRTISEYAVQQADMVSLQAERKITEIQNVLEALSGSDRLRAFSGYSSTEFSTQAVEMLNLRSEFSNNLIPTICSDLYVYFNNSQSCMGIHSRNYSESMMFLFYQSKNITETEFQDILSFSGLFGTHIFEDGRIWMMRSFYDDSLQRAGVLIAEIMAEDIVDYIDEAYRDNLLILSSNDIVFYCSHPLTDSQLIGILQETEENFNISVGGKHFRVAHESIPVMQWNFHVGIPSDKLYEGLRVFQVIFILECLATLVTALFLSWKFASKTFEPLRQLIDILQKGTDSRFRETYANLIGELTALVKENRTLSMNDEIRKQYASTDTMRHILDGTITDASAAEPLMSGLAHVAQSDSYRLVLIDLPDRNRESAGESSAGRSLDDVNLKSFILRNVSTELIFTPHEGYLFQYSDSCYIMVIRVLDSSDEEILTEKLQKLIDFYHETLGIYPHILLGQPVSGYQRLSSTFSAMKEEMRYHMFWLDDSSLGKVWLMDSQEIQEEKTGLSEYLDYSRRLINCLEIGDYREADSTLDYMFSHTFPRNPRYLQYNIYRMYGLISTLSITLDIQTEKKDQEFFAHLNYEERLYGAKTFSQFRQISQELFASILNYNASKEKNGMPVWMDNVLDYISENYADISLSVSSVADHFQLSVPHLSRTFKSTMGIGVLEYIHRLRIENAKKLLDLGENVQEAAEASGFLDAKALRRAFHRYEGINPGQYREMKKGKAQDGSED